MFRKIDVAFRTVASGLLSLLSAVAFCQLQVTTYHNDMQRTGLNPRETILTPGNVNSNTFGLLFSLPVDGQVYAQPLYLQGVQIPGKGLHNVVFVATQHNSLYAFDADSNTGSNATPLWHVNFGPSVPNGDVGTGDINPEIGITSTPVIHTLRNGTNAIYVTCKTKTINSSNNPVYTHTIHVLSVSTGAELLKGPFVIHGSVPGTGDGSVNGTVTFTPLIQHSRSALLIVPNATKDATLYVAFASHGDNGPYHGWVFIYDADLMVPYGIINTTPNATTPPGGPIAAGGVWQGGSGLASDGYSVFFATGNGTFNPATKSYGDSILRYLIRSYTVADFFTPTDQQTLDDNDTDLGSGGVVLLPSSASGASKTSLLVQVGKEGTVHLLNTAKLGGFNATADNVVQELSFSNGGIWGSPAYFNNTVYFGPIFSSLLAYPIKNGLFTSTSPTSFGNTSYQYPGCTPSVSANGLANGIVWAIQAANWSTGGPASLQAYDATNLGNTLYDSSATNGRDAIGPAIKFSVPTVINGKVYVGTANSVSVFGLGSWAAAPVITPASGTYTGSVTVTVTDTTPNAVIHYTIDGSTPTINSPKYSTPVKLNASVLFQAKAFLTASGNGGSTVVQANYLVNPVIGTGTGLTGNYFNNSQNPGGTPTFTELDPTVNFNWNGGSPAPGVAGTNWAGEWIGQVEPETTATYTFTTQSDDGVQLFVNGQQIINDFSAHSPTFDSGAITLQAGKKYTIDLKYFQAGGGSLLQLFWSAPGLPMQIIPSSQLYPSN